MMFDIPRGSHVSISFLQVTSASPIEPLVQLATRLYPSTQEYTLSLLVIRLPFPLHSIFRSTTPSFANMRLVKPIGEDTSLLT